MSPSKSGTSRAETVADDLEAEILLKQHPVGTRLGLRTELISRFGVSPGVVNEALRLLRERGLITVKPGPNGGVFVADAPPGVRLNELDLWFQRLTIEPLEIFEARVLLDDLFYVLAVERATDDDVRRIRRVLHDMEDATADPVRFFQSTVNFHLAVAVAAKVPVLLGLYESLAAVLLTSLVRATFRDNPGRIETSVEQHKALLDAIQARDTVQLKHAVEAHRTGLVSSLEPERSPLSSRVQATSEESSRDARRAN